MMNKFFLLFAMTFALSVTSVASYAQNEPEEESKGTLASMFESWNERQKDKLKRHAGIVEQEEDQSIVDTGPTEAYKRTISIRQAEGARSRIFDPVTSWIEQRRAYQQKNLAHHAMMDEGREKHQASIMDEEKKLDTERGLHLKASMAYDQTLLGERQDHLQQSQNADAKYDEQRAAYLQKFIANHRKYLELDVEN